MPGGMPGQRRGPRNAASLGALRRGLQETIQETRGQQGGMGMGGGGGGSSSALDPIGDGGGGGSMGRAGLFNADAESARLQSKIRRPKLPHQERGRPASGGKSANPNLPINAAEEAEAQRKHEMTKPGTSGHIMEIIDAEHGGSYEALNQKLSTRDFYDPYRGTDLHQEYSSTLSEHIKHQKELQGLMPGGYGMLRNIQSAMNNRFAALPPNAPNPYQHAMSALGINKDSSATQIIARCLGDFEYLDRLQVGQFLCLFPWTQTFVWAAWIILTIKLYQYQRDHNWEFYYDSYLGTDLRIANPEVRQICLFFFSVVFVRGFVWHPLALASIVVTRWSRLLRGKGFGP